MTNTNVNPQPELIPAASLSEMEKSRPPTENFSLSLPGHRQLSVY